MLPEQNGAILNDNPCIGLFNNKSHYKVDKHVTDKMKIKRYSVKSLSKHLHVNCHHLPSVLSLVYLRLAEWGVEDTQCNAKR